MYADSPERIAHCADHEAPYQRGHNMEQRTKATALRLETRLMAHDLHSLHRRTTARFHDATTEQQEVRTEHRSVNHAICAEAHREECPLEVALVHAVPMETICLAPRRA